MLSTSSYSGGMSGFVDQYAAVAIVALLIWVFAWKGWALWYAARRNEKIWFIALLLINTVGILEIVYIFLIAKRRDKEVITSEPPKEI